MSHLSVQSQPLPWLWQDTSISLLESPTTTADIKIYVPPATPPTSASGTTQKTVFQSSPLKANANTVVSIQSVQRSSRSSFLKKWRKIEDPTSTTSNAGSITPLNLPSTPPSMTTTTVATSTSSTTTCISNGSSSRARVSFITEAVTTSEQTSNSTIADLCTKIASNMFPRPSQIWVFEE
ncbi:hypothetical protein BDZ45DRAFT_415225 [Acephala macrosclerotiorum]|nr:hypothetical protein BDZ45DRAFT_415225 [Acephala macrosclerotiorum]